jgi:hypothetical protein
MERSRWIALGVMLIGCAAFVAGLVPMTERVRTFNATHPPLRMHVEPITSREFSYADFPPARITDAKDAPGRAMVRLEFAGNTTDIPVKAPPAPNLPGLAAYDEWLKVLGIQESSVTKETIGAKKGTERLFIITRRTPDGYDPDAWGSVRRIEWVFEFYELKRDGTIERSTWRWPRSYRAESRLAREADASQPMPASIVTETQKAEWRADIERAQHLLAIKPLAQRSLEYFLALHVMPKLSVPNYKFNDTAFNLEVLGWTMPVTMCSVLAMAGGLVFLVAPRKRKANEARP